MSIDLLETKLRKNASGKFVELMATPPCAPAVVAIARRAKMNVKIFFVIMFEILGPLPSSPEGEVFDDVG